MTTQMLLYARERHVASLYEPRRYRPGKVTNIGAGKTKRETLCELPGPGVLR